MKAEKCTCGHDKFEMKPRQSSKMILWGVYCRKCGKWQEWLKKDENKTCGLPVGNSTENAKTPDVDNPILSMGTLTDEVYWDEGINIADVKVKEIVEALRREVKICRSVGYTAGMKAAVEIILTKELKGYEYIKAKS